jgi:DNA-binding beta-propeller fold protein YncE
LFFLPFIAEVLFFPIYLTRLGIIKGEHFKRIVTGIHLSVVLFSCAVLFTPFNQESVSVLESLGKKDVYAMKISRVASKLFFVNFESLNETWDFCECLRPTRNSPNVHKVESLDLTNPRKQFLPVYSGEVLAEDFDINDASGEIYIIDRTKQRLVIMQMSDYQAQKHLDSELFSVDHRDFRLAARRGGLYLAHLEPENIMKIDTVKPGLDIKNSLYSYINALVWSDKYNVLYTADGMAPREDFNYQGFYIYEIDGDSLKIRRTVPIPGGSSDLVLSNDQTRIYCVLPLVSFLRSQVHVYDSEKLVTIDKINVPYGSRTLAIDEKRSIVFVGNALTGLIDAIDLESKRVIATYMAGKYSLREIVLDEDRRAFYVSTQYFGLYKGTY